MIKSDLIVKWYVSGAKWSIVTCQKVNEWKVTKSGPLTLSVHKCTEVTEFVKFTLVIQSEQK